ncbi:hypothetical protein R1flu_027982 [Riccia fluitans]|uniref:Uncharacterized protein n=1 Tax=Riccia fluitans TaxID=41844 RepID=A0ABD1XKD4_9MARC
MFNFVFNLLAYAETLVITPIWNFGSGEIPIVEICKLGKTAAEIAEISNDLLEAGYGTAWKPPAIRNWEPYVDLC